jgi:AcrR family transcriptional regulator
MPRPRITEERRRQILEAAAAVIAERGVCDARVSDIARRIGASSGLILYYFPSKDALLAEALAYRDQQFFDSVAGGLTDGKTPMRRLLELVDASCPPADQLGADSEWLLWLDTWTRSRHDETLAATRARMDKLFRQAISDIVRQGVESGDFRSVDPRLFAIHLSALIDGLAIQVLLDDPAVDSAQMRSICRKYIRETLEVGVRAG